MARAWQLFSKRRIHRTELLIQPRGLPLEQHSWLVNRSTSRGPEHQGTSSPAQAQSRGLERQGQDHAEQPASFWSLTRLGDMVDSITQAWSDVLLTKIVNNKGSI